MSPPGPGASASSVSLADKVAFLSRPAAYRDRPQRVESIETHVSSLFLTDSFAYKLKKPVRFDYLDFTALEARQAECLEEVRLNRRLAGRPSRRGRRWYSAPMDCSSTARAHRSTGGPDAPPVPGARRRRRHEPRTGRQERRRARGRHGCPVLGGRGDDDRWGAEPAASRSPRFAASVPSDRVRPRTSAGDAISSIRTPS